MMAREDLLEVACDEMYHVHCALVLFVEHKATVRELTLAVWPISCPAMVFPCTAGK